MGSNGLENGGPLVPNIVFGVLCVVFTLAFQWEHAARCYVLPLQRNAARMFILAPAYTAFIFLTAHVTPAKPVWDICMAILDGYALYCFLALVVLGAGGEEVVVAKLAQVMARAPSGVAREEAEEEDREDGGEDGPDGIAASTAPSSIVSLSSSVSSTAGPDGLPPRPVTYRCCLCLPLHFRDACGLYRFLKRSVVQVIITRPVCLALSALCDFGTTRRAAGGTRLFRVLALALLVYAVMTIARVYHLVRQQIWAAFNPVASFMVVKGFILVITVQDFFIAMIYSARDPHYELHATRRALRAYSLVVAVEALVYLFCSRQLLHPKIFAGYSPRTALRMHISYGDFLCEVYNLWNVFRGQLPPPGEKPQLPPAGAAAAAEPGLVGPEEVDADDTGAGSDALRGGASGSASAGSGGEIEIRVLSSSSSGAAAAAAVVSPGSPARRR